MFFWKPVQFKEKPEISFISSNSFSKSKIQDEEKNLVTSQKSSHLISKSLKKERHN